MKVRALCIRLVMIVLMLLVAHVQQSYPKTPYAAFRIVPTRLQLFEYESVHFTCEGFNVSAGCTVRNIKESIQKCSNDTVTSTVTCTIDYAFVSDTGEYWCEGGGGERSNTVDITVTGGHVILESPVLPVMEGDAVTLSCRYETSSTSLPAVFYKDGLFIGNSSTGNMTIERVSRSDEGLYKCDISGAGESPESRLAVRDGSSTSVSNSDEGLKKSGISGAGESSQIGLAVKASHKDVHFPLPFYILLGIIVTVVLFLQLLVMGLLYLKKQLVLLEANLNDPKKDLYAVVKKNRKKKKKKKKDAADAEDNLSFGLDSTYCTKPQTEKDNAEPLPQSFRSTFTFDDTSPALQDDEEEETPY
ncbi:low affinity immunoglobulin gamma Fc region receptor II-a-like isoform X1 [Anoplopoma fimbria]|uniref:low affinity immunoglobulin gamma Fc region receptor II-a-like isoform X1 n=1 Tax=Anoplopoma fimbria TaxID=229290 RepID=UPI0023EA97BF|nr:low affinity immunoglobulin gamma Fc region receptor II-a-like isoform X1 [Anoplopoma fimbria]